MFGGIPKDLTNNIRSRFWPRLCGLRAFGVSAERSKTNSIAVRGSSALRYEPSAWPRRCQGGARTGDPQGSTRFSALLDNVIWLTPPLARAVPA